jgi:hypothetical protein
MRSCSALPRCQAEQVPELVLDGVNGRRLVLSDPRPPDEDEIWSYTASLTLPVGQVTTEVWDAGTGLATFLRELADAWRGFDGIKEFHALEGQFSLECRHDGRGTVNCVVYLGQPEPPAWTVIAEIDFGAGAHLERIASQAEAFRR